MCIVRPVRHCCRSDADGRRRVRDVDLMEVFNLREVAPLGGVRERIGCDPFDVDLILIRRYLAWVDSEPGPIDEGRVRGRYLVDRPMRAPIIRIGEVGLKWERQLLE